MNRKFVIVFVVTALIGCAKHSQMDGLDSANLLSSVVSEMNAYPNLGYAYDNRLDKVFEYPCVKGVEESFGAPHSTVKYYHNRSFDQIKKGFGLEFSIGIPVTPTVSVAPGIEYARENASSELNSTQSIEVKIYGKSKRFKPESIKISSAGQLVVDRIPEKAYLRCGNEFVNRVDYGATLSATLKTSYANKTDKKVVGAKVGLGFGLSGFFSALSINVGAKTLNEKVRERTVVTVSAIQIGGDPRGLTSVLPTAQLSCKLSNMDPCIKAFESILAYARSFSKQINSNTDLVPIRHTTSLYRDAGADLGNLFKANPKDTDQQEVIYKLNTLKMLLRSELLNFQRSSELLANQQDLITLRHIAIIRNVNELSMKNSKILEEAINVCKNEDVDSCLTVKAELSKYDAGKLVLNGGPWRNSFLGGEVLRLVMNSVDGFVSGNIYCKVKLGGGHSAKMSAPCRPVAGSTYLIRMYQRDICQFPAVSYEVRKACKDPNYINGQYGFSVSGVNGATGGRGTYASFNANLEKNEISIWGSIFEFDSDTGVIYNSKNKEIGYLKKL
jgi:hypothetical protein